MRAARIAARGLIQVPGGQGVFPALTVAENLTVARVAAPARPRVREDSHRARCSTCSLACAHDCNDPAAHLSGGQQQMLAVAMAFLAKPEGAA